MADQFKSRRLIAAGARRVTAVASLIWLNLAMLPCAMAFDKEHSCPGCPTEPKQEMALHQSQVDAEKSTSCNLAKSDCCELDQLNVDYRSQKFEKDDGAELALVADLSIAQWSTYSSVPRFPTGPPDPAPGASRLHALYCVYLN